jgi:hypothetical protein
MPAGASPAGALPSNVLPTGVLPTAELPMDRAFTTASSPPIPIQSPIQRAGVGEESTTKSPAAVTSLVPKEVATSNATSDVTGDVTGDIPDDAEGEARGNAEAGTLLANTEVENAEAATTRVANTEAANTDVAKVDVAKVDAGEMPDAAASVTAETLAPLPTVENTLPRAQAAPVPAMRSPDETVPGLTTAPSRVEAPQPVEAGARPKRRKSSQPPPNPTSQVEPAVTKETPIQPVSGKGVDPLPSSIDAAGIADEGAVLGDVETPDAKVADETTNTPLVQLQGADVVSVPTADTAKARAVANVATQQSDALLQRVSSPFGESLEATAETPRLSQQPPTMASQPVPRQSDVSTPVVTKEGAPASAVAAPQVIPGAHEESMPPVPTLSSFSGREEASDVAAPIVQRQSDPAVSNESRSKPVPDEQIEQAITAAERVRRPQSAAGVKASPLNAPLAESNASIVQMQSDGPAPANSEAAEPPKGDADQAEKPSTPEVDTDELARKVYGELKRKLALEGERLRLSRL